MNGPGGNDNVVVIIRTVGERTSSWCRRLVQMELPGAPVYTVSERPFSKTLRRSYEVGLRTGAAWTLCIDGDLLVAQGALTALLCTAHSPSNRHVFEIQGLVVDKLFGVRRPAGNHLYRTALLARAVDLIPAENTSLRPESDTILAMARRGYPWIQLEQVVGIHDYEQYYRDIYMKVYLQARKFRRFKDTVLERWNNALGDRDFEVAQRAWTDSEAMKDDVFADSAIAKGDRLSEVLSELGLKEKSPLPDCNLQTGYPAEVISRFSPALSAAERRMIPQCNVPLGPNNRPVRPIAMLARRIETAVHGLSFKSSART